MRFISLILLTFLVACAEAPQDMDAVDLVTGEETAEVPEGALEPLEIDPANLPILSQDGEAPVIGDTRLAAARSNCLEKAGTFSSIEGGAGFICFLETADGGKQCAKSTDCTTECLARSRSCAPITPLLGCHDVFTANGATVTQCRE